MWQEERFLPREARICGAGRAEPPFGGDGGDGGLAGRRVGGPTGRRVIGPQGRRIGGVVGPQGRRVGGSAGRRGLRVLLSKYPNYLTIGKSPVGKKRGPLFGQLAYFCGSRLSKLKTD